MIENGSNQSCFSRNGNHTKMLSEYTLSGEVGTFTLVTKPSHDGNLECLATLQNNTKSIEPTVSNRHYLKVVGECFILIEIYYVSCLHDIPVPVT